ncbi:type II 3-dehydroquinate dehydratase [Streptomyces sp. NPDC005438]|uniref:type II 3-dehydroquinate dehydratase n=1 Tax=Streptomyces sp. NPDC005438 TaxID=3156880 RepID=UPI0033A9E9B4
MDHTLRPPGAVRWRIGVLDGPNMPNLGNRDQRIYGPIRSLADLQALVRDFAGTLGVEVEQTASNHEGDLLDFVHRTAGEVHGYVINPAGLTTYGEATRHALDDTGKPVVEVHFANTVRHFAQVAPAPSLQNSRFTATATGLVMGLRQYSYLGALLGLTLALDDADFLAGGAHRH